MADKGVFFKLLVGAFQTILENRSLPYVERISHLDRIYAFTRHVFIVFTIAAAKVDSFQMKKYQKEHHDVIRLFASLYKSTVNNEVSATRGNRQLDNANNGMLTFYILEIDM